MDATVTLEINGVEYEFFCEYEVVPLYSPDVNDRLNDYEVYVYKFTDGATDCSFLLSIPDVFQYIKQQLVNED